MMLSHSTKIQLAISTSTLQGIALLLTIFRLWFRFNIRRLWWEDVWTFVALCSCVGGLIGQWFFYKRPYPSTANYVGMLFYAFAFTVTVWAVRMSLLCSILRVVYSSQRLRRRTLAVALLFVLMGAGLIAQKVYICMHDRFCQVTTPMIAYELTTDVVSDAFLVSMPLRLLWNIKLPKRQRRMILLNFSSVIILTLWAIVHAVCMFFDLSGFNSFITDIETGLSILLCNLMVVVTFAYRVTRRRETATVHFDVATTDVATTEAVMDTRDDDYTTPTRDPSAPQFTTIDFGSLVDSTQSGMGQSGTSRATDILSSDAFTNSDSMRSSDKPAPSRSMMENDLSDSRGNATG
ncbi:hypothetical protein HYDPIDRAFT_112665 [Hydnomerulius pinastri MD-312]|uniref:Unplaced genomic scaffold scaffold_14, whole genome shotgun sequence n=1 Tax=Hydnomerulius pinastri MD-312 TaxID=994086 RepID=A0A0C9W071_9AGAM|nr:hypothetical protein HYDPIDRAFT_112665 [Hydnomerulius pinastri MD-312]